MTPEEHADFLYASCPDQNEDGYCEFCSSVDALVAERDALAARLAEAERACEKAVRERRSLEVKEDDWHRAYEAAEARVAELEQFARGEAESNQRLHEHTAALTEALTDALVVFEGTKWADAYRHLAVSEGTTLRLLSVENDAATEIHRRAAICPDCGKALLLEFS